MALEMCALQFCCLYEISPLRGHMFYKYALSSLNHLSFYAPMYLFISLYININIFNFSLSSRSSQLDEAHTNDIKFDIHPEL